MTQAPWRNPEDGGRGRRIVSSRPAWATSSVLRQTGLQSEDTVSEQMEETSSYYPYQQQNREGSSRDEENH